VLSLVPPVERPSQNCDIPDLRRALAAAIDRRRKAEDRATVAKDIAKRAESARLEAKAYLVEYKAAHDAKAADLREQHIRRVADAIRQDKPVPGMAPAPVLDNDALQAAQDQYGALEVSATLLALEAQEAATEAGKAMGEVQAQATAVMDHDYAARHAELLAALSIVRALEEQISGFHILDEARPGGPRFAKEKVEISIALDRDAALQAADPQLIEAWKIRAHYDKVNADARQRWQDFHRRLCSDHTAVFDATEEPSQ
jgi:hypothetical protein